MYCGASPQEWENERGGGAGVLANTGAGMGVRTMCAALSLALEEWGRGLC